MECSRCGASLGPGVRECPDCGNHVYGNDYVYASITVTWEEARKGGVYPVELRNLVDSIRVRIKPRSRNGDKVRVAGAMFHMPDESIMLAPVEVTVHVEPRPLWQPVLAAMLCLLLLAGVGVGIWAVVDSFGDQPAQQVSSTLPSQPQQTTPPTIAPTVQTDPGVTEPSSQPETTAATEPAETETTAVTEPPTEPPTQDPTESQQSSSVIMNFEMRPLLQQLSEEHLADLEAMYQAAMNFETTTTLPYEVTVEELDYLVVLLNAECPELMQLDISAGYTYYYDTDTNIVSSYEYVPCMTQAEYEEKYDACVQVIDSLVAQTQGMTDLEKERFVFDYITSNCTYDMDIAYAGTAYGTLVQEVAKCDGISLATKWLLEEMGVTCIMVTGDPTVGEIGHAWNYVLLDGQYYGLDVTADVRRVDDQCPVLNCAFNVNTDVVDQTYILRPTFAEFVETPNVTTMEKSYHVENSSYMVSGADWQSYVKEAFQENCQNSGDFYLQFESKSDYDACVAGLNQVIDDAWQNSGFAGSVSWMTWTITEFCVIYVEITYQ